MPLAHIRDLGKAAKPRCFKKLNIKELPVTWRSNRTSWMTANLFDEWLTSVNKMMIKEKRNILLFIDHAPCHNDSLEYSNITVKFFPANTTSKLQPLDQGIIKNFKCFYRKYSLFSTGLKSFACSFRTTTC